MQGIGIQPGAGSTTANVTEQRAVASALSSLATAAVFAVIKDVGALPVTAVLIFRAADAVAAPEFRYKGTGT